LAETALIVGAGSGLSAALARLFAKQGMQVALAARDTDKLKPLIAETKARAYACDASDAQAVATLFQSVARDLAVPDLVVFNAGYRTRGAVETLDPAEVQKALAVTAFGGFLVAQAAAKAMLTRGHGTILLTGASASVKGYAQSSPFAMGKFALRGLAQSLARELGPQNIHVAHIVIDGGIRRANDPRSAERGADGMLEPDAIAESYLMLHRQHRNAWSAELELRPWVEKF
jgi:NAD(P)-dependent dehydrogenase (short-subunit alcohol dehydrogenase family)